MSDRVKIGVCLQHEVGEGPGQLLSVFILGVERLLEQLSEQTSIREERLKDGVSERVVLSNE